MTDLTPEDHARLNSLVTCMEDTVAYMEASVRLLRTIPQLPADAETELEGPLCPLVDAIGDGMEQGGEAVKALMALIDETPGGPEATRDRTMAIAVRLVDVIKDAMTLHMELCEGDER